MSDKTFEQWGIVELFGHNKIAGMISEQSIGGCSFVRVDVPAIGDNQGYTKVYGNGAIYAMTFTDEETAKAAAKMYSPRPIDVFEAKRLLEPPPSYDDDAPLTDEDMEEFRV